MHAARKTLTVLLCAFVGVLLGLAAPGGRDDAPPPRSQQSLEVHALVVKGSRLDKPEPFAAATLGWRWSGTVRVYDGTGDPAWKVAEAAQEWGSRTGLHTQVVDRVAAAQIVVYEVDQFTDPGYPGAIGLTYWPHVTGAVADGQCRIELLSWVPARSALTAEHDALHELGHCFGLSHDTVDKRTVMAPTVQLGEGYSRPQAADYRNLQSVYGR